MGVEIADGIKLANHLPLKWGDYGIFIEYKYTDKRIGSVQFSRSVVSDSL